MKTFLSFLLLLCGGVAWAAPQPSGYLAASPRTNIVASTAGIVIAAPDNRWTWTVSPAVLAQALTNTAAFSNWLFNGASGTNGLAGTNYVVTAVTNRVFVVAGSTNVGIVTNYGSGTVTYTIYATNDGGGGGLSLIGFTNTTSTNLSWSQPKQFQVLGANTAFVITNLSTNGATMHVALTNTGSWTIGFAPGTGTNVLKWGNGLPRGGTNVWSDFYFEQTTTNILADFSERLVPDAGVMYGNDGTNIVLIPAPTINGYVLSANLSLPSKVEWTNASSVALATNAISAVWSNNVQVTSLSTNMNFWFSSLAGVNVTNRSGSSGLVDVTFSTLSASEITNRLNTLSNALWTLTTTASTNYTDSISNNLFTNLVAQINTSSNYIYTNFTATFGQAGLRTNKFTTNVPATAVIGTLWWRATATDFETNGARSGFEYHPARGAFRFGGLSTTASVSNYWDSTNVGVGSFAAGSNVLAVGDYSVSLGIANTIFTNAFGSSILGGGTNTILANSGQSVIAGGMNNTIQGGVFASTIGGGRLNVIGTAAASDVTIGGGLSHVITGTGGTIGGGVDNYVYELGGTISGGANNTTESGDYATIGGGLLNANGGDWTFIGGGANNTLHSQASGANGTASAIVGGNYNVIGVLGAGAKYSFVGGGRTNSIQNDADYSVIVGGSKNRIGIGVNGGVGNFIGGGFNNLTDDQIDYATIGGGVLNVVNGDYGAILGGASNNVAAAYAFVIGSRITNGTANSVELGYGNSRKTRVDSSGIVSTTSGGATNRTSLGGTLVVSNSPIASAGSSETNLITYSIPDHTLTNNNDRIKFRFAGRFAATANAKDMKVIYGSETIFDTSSQIVNSGAWTIMGEIIRTGDSSQSVSAEFHGAGITLFTTAAAASLAQTNGIATVLKMTSTAIGDGDVTNRSLVVEYYPTPVQ